MNKIIAFVKESWAELKQCSWLTPPQMIASTWMVILLSAVMALFIAAVDFVLSSLLRFVV